MVGMISLVHTNPGLPLVDGFDRVITPRILETSRHLNAEVSHANKSNPMVRAGVESRGQEIRASSNISI